MKQKIFGTDGVRGVANSFPIDSETVLKLGRASAHVLGREKGRHRVLIGKDTRISGYMLETALCSGIVSMGVDVYLVGPLPTPGIAYLTKSMLLDAGVVISASHNPFEDNGIKFFGHDGFKLPDSVEAEIETLMFSEEIHNLKADQFGIGKAQRIEDAVGRYVVYLKSCLHRNTSLEGLKVVIDCANGATYKVAPLVFSELGAECIVIGDRPNGKNINHNCGSLHPEELIQTVIREGAHLGVSYDGDGDRVLLCDELGRIFDGDRILLMLADFLLEEGKLKGGGIVGTVMSNLGFEKSVMSRGLKLVRSDVGDRYVLQSMIQHGMNLGGEQSGHIISLDHNTTGDGILSSLLAVELLLRKNKPLSSFYNLFEPYPQVIVNVPVAKKVPFDQIKGFSDLYADETKRLNDRGRILLRYSGTESKARVMVECDDDQLCNLVANNLADALRSSLSA